MKVLFALFCLGISTSLSEIQTRGGIDSQQITQYDAMGKEENAPLLIDGKVTSCVNVDRQLNVSFKITGEFKNLRAQIYTEGGGLSSLGNGVDVRIKSHQTNVKCNAAGTRKQSRSTSLVSIYDCSLAGARRSPNVTIGIDTTSVTDINGQLKICEVKFLATEVLQNADSINIPTKYSDTRQGNFSVSQDFDRVTSFTTYNDNTQYNPLSSSIPGWTITDEYNVSMNLSGEQHSNATKVYRKNEYSITALTVIVVCCLTSFATAIMGITIFANHWLDVRKKNKRTKRKRSSDVKRNVFYLAIEAGNLSNVPEAPKEQEENCSTFKIKKKMILASVEQNEQSGNSSTEPIVKQSHPECVDNNLKDCAIYDDKEMPEVKKDSEVAMTENELYTAFK